MRQERRSEKQHTDLRSREAAIIKSRATVRETAH